MPRCDERAKEITEEFIRKMAEVEEVTGLAISIGWAEGFENLTAGTFWLRQPNSIEASNLLSRALTVGKNLITAFLDARNTKGEPQEENGDTDSS